MMDTARNDCDRKNGLFCFLAAAIESHWWQPSGHAALSRRKCSQRSPQRHQTRCRKRIHRKKVKARDGRRGERTTGAIDRGLGHTKLAIIVAAADQDKAVRRIQKISRNPAIRWRYGVRRNHIENERMRAALIITRAWEGFVKRKAMRRSRAGADALLMAPSRERRAVISSDLREMRARSSFVEATRTQTAYDDECLTVQEDTDAERAAACPAQMPRNVDNNAATIETVTGATEAVTEAVNDDRTRTRFESGSTMEESLSSPEDVQAEAGLNLHHYTVPEARTGSTNDNERAELEARLLQAVTAVLMRKDTAYAGPQGAIEGARDAGAIAHDHGRLPEIRQPVHVAREKFVTHPLQLVKGQMLLYEQEMFSLYALMDQVKGWTLALGVAPVLGGCLAREGEEFAVVCGFSAAFGPLLLERAHDSIFSNRKFFDSPYALPRSHVRYMMTKYWEQDIAPFDAAERLFRLVSGCFSDRIRKADLQPFIEAIADRHPDLRMLPLSPKATYVEHILDVACSGCRLPIPDGTISVNDLRADGFATSLNAVGRMEVALEDSVFNSPPPIRTSSKSWGERGRRRGGISNDRACPGGPHAKAPTSLADTRRMKRRQRAAYYVRRSRYGTLSQKVTSDFDLVRSRNPTTIDGLVAVS